ncbi:MAG: MBL fold metallo-hydrolase [Pseudomonadota bacterium]
MKITTLIENSPGEHKALTHEHGLSFFIETDALRILFDTGQSGAFLANAELLNVDLLGLDSVVISHGHYDHSGGFRSLTERTTRFNLFLGQGFFREKYGQRGAACDYLGNNFDENFVQKQQISIKFVDEPLLEIASGVFLFSGFPRIHDDEIINRRFQILEAGQLCQDPFDDEIVLAVDSPQGLVVFLGCSHPGMKNILDAVVQRTGRPLFAVLGGSHLVEASGTGMEESLHYLEKDSLKIVGLCHCTGQPAMDRLSAGNRRYFKIGTGSSVFIG